MAFTSLAHYTVLAASGFAAFVSYFSVGRCGHNGRFCEDACARLGAHAAEHLVGQEHALTQLHDLVCDHLSNTRPLKPLVVSLHGPVGVGKSSWHGLLAESLYNMTGQPGREDSCEDGLCPGYRVVFGTDWVAAESSQQASLLRSSVVSHLTRHPESVLVIEEFDKSSCESRALLRQLLDKGVVGNTSAVRSIIVLEANAGSLQLFKLMNDAGSRASLSVERMHRALKDVVYQAWSRDGCEDAIDTQKLLSSVDVFVPFLPLERSHVRGVADMQLRERRKIGIARGDFLSLEWDDAVLDLLTDKCEFERGPDGVLYSVEGAKEVRNVLATNVARAVRLFKAEAAEPRAARLRVVQGAIRCGSKGKTGSWERRDEF
jgi:ATP-dependent Clp protease ATP-binding subunit ClpA